MTSEAEGTIQMVIDGVDVEVTITVEILHECWADGWIWTVESWSAVDDEGDEVEVTHDDALFIASRSL